MARSRIVIGVISDTHGLVRPEAVDGLRGSDLIVHCGDVGAPVVLDALRAIAPIHAVRGNNDKGSWASKLPSDDMIELGRHTVYAIHDLHELAFEPAAPDLTAVLFGHSHRPVVEERGGVIFVSPGSAGPRRFRLPVAIAQLVLSDRRCDVRIIDVAS
jgi:hypothetical protein